MNKNNISSSGNVLSAVYLIIFYLKIYRRGTKMTYSITRPRSSMLEFDDRGVSVQEMVSYFEKAPSLSGKPKLFFIETSKLIIGSKEKERDVEICSPEILIVRSSVLSDSLLSPEESFFKRLIHKLEDDKESWNIMHIISKVNMEMYRDYTVHLTQMGAIICTFTKQVYFQRASSDMKSV